jgi:hypothetical protein
VQEANAIVKAMQDAKYKERVDKAREEYTKRGWKLQSRWNAFEDDTSQSMTSLQRELTSKNAISVAQ